MIHYIAGNFEAGNLLHVTVTAIVGQHSQVSVHCLISSAISPDQIFWRETVSLLMSSELEVTKESAHCCKEISCLTMLFAVRKSTVATASKEVP